MTSRTVLVTGGSRGIGRAISAYYLEKGWKVLRPTRRDFDLSSLAEIQAWLEANPLQVDVLVNNAGENPIGPIEAMTPEIWARSLQVNLTGPMLLAQAAARHMRTQRWGRIVNVSSIFGHVSRAGRAPYTAAKTGLVGFTRTAAIEWGSDNVLVNAICPGYIETDLTRQNNTPDQIKVLADGLPLRRLGQPEEVARAAYFLGSEENTFITGQTLVIDGGFTAQ